MNSRYGELHSKDINGMTIYDEIREFKSANISDGKLKICLRAIVDGKENELFIEKTMEELLEIRKLQARYNNSVDLDRNDYQTKCSKIDNNFSIFVRNSHSLSHLSEKKITLNYPYLDNTLNYFIIAEFVSKDSDFTSLYDRGFALYFSESNSLSDGGRFLLFYIENPYHQEYDVSWYQYGIALGIDFVTMPVQILLLAQYLGGGAS